MAVAALLASACAFGGGDEPVSPGALTVVPPCHVAGCSAQVCSEREDVVTTCEWRAEYACYQSARCEPQADGLCGWTPTPELLACIEAAGSE
jgi:eight-cysteine-cluster-containing protein